VDATEQARQPVQRIDGRRRDADALANLPDHPDQGVELAFDTPEQLRERLERELVKWRKIVDASGARVD